MPSVDFRPQTPCDFALKKESQISSTHLMHRHVFPYPPLKIKVNWLIFTIELLEFQQTPIFY